MKRLVHDSWPLAAVVALTVVLALQIPRKALFFSPVAVVANKPFASFVTYDAASYEAVMQKVRMSWQMSGVTEPSFESRVDAVDFSADVPAFAPLGLPSEFLGRHEVRPLADTPVPLLPPSVADGSALIPVAEPPDDRVEVKKLRADLLAIPESLQSNE